MCEAISAWSQAFIDWTPDADRFRLSSAAQDHDELAQRYRARSTAFPDKAEEDAASEALARVDEVIAARFGLDPVASRYILCSIAAAQRRPILGLALAAEQLSGEARPD